MFVALLQVNDPEDEEGDRVWFRLKSVDKVSAMEELRLLVVGTQRVTGCAGHEYVANDGGFRRPYDVREAILLSVDGATSGPLERWYSDDAAAERAREDVLQEKNARAQYEVLKARFDGKQ